MSKCKPDPTAELANLEQYGVTFKDVTTQQHGLHGAAREVVLSIPYEALLNNPDVQRAFQHLIRVST
jgi:hypothetical protein